MKEKITKLKEVFDKKYDQFLVWITLSTAKILNKRYDLKSKEQENLYQKFQIALDKKLNGPIHEYRQKNKDDAEKKNHEANLFLKEQSEIKKKKIESLPHTSDGRIKIDYGSTEKKSKPLSIILPCEKLWSAVFGEQTSLTIEEFESKKEKLFSEIEKIFNECKNESEVDDIYKDLINKNCFVNKIDKATKLSLVLVDYLLEKENIKQKIEEANSKRLTFLKENTKTEIIKACGCLEHCYCETARRIILTETSQEFVLFDNVNEIAERYRNDPFYQSLGLEIVQVHSDNDLSFELIADESCSFLDSSGKLFKTEGKNNKLNYENINFELHQFSLDQLRKAKDIIDSNYSPSFIISTQLFVCPKTLKTNIICLMRSSQSVKKLHEKEIDVSGFSDLKNKYFKTSTYVKDLKDQIMKEVTESDISVFKDLITESSKDPDFSISIDSKPKQITYSFNKKINEITSDDLKICKEYIDSEFTK